jgi:hypothetical protein
MPILLAAKVARVEDAQPSHLDEEHRSAEHVAGVVAREAQAACDLHLLVVVDGLDLPPGRQHLGLVEELVIGAGVAA